MKFTALFTLLLMTSVSYAWDSPQIDSAWRTENRQQLNSFATDDSFSSLYAQYRIAMIAINHDEKKRAKKPLEAIKDAIKDNYQTPDEAALYSAALGLSIALKPWQAAFIAGSADDALEFSFNQTDSHAPTFMVKGIALYNTPGLLGGDKAMALTLFNKAIALYEENEAWGMEDAWLWKAKTQYKLGNESQAQATLDQLIKRFPDFKEALNLELSAL